MARSISVIIPNFNGKKLLAENLSFVMESLEGVSLSEIIIVDDASTDNSITFLKNNYPDIKIIENNKNIGFGPSVNAGLKAAQHELVFLLNNDIKPDKNYIATSFKYFDDPETFGVMGLIKDELTGEILEGIKRPLISASGLKYKDIRWPGIEACTDQVFTLYVCGGSAIVNREKMIKLKGFLDIYHPFYQEDVDLSVRAWITGWKLYFNPKATCYHKHSATIKKYYSSEFIDKISKRNRLILSYMYLTGYQKAVFFRTTYIKSLYYRFLYTFNRSSVYPGYKEFFNMVERLKSQTLSMNNTEKLSHIVKKIQRSIKRNLK
jgi:GT2 family glycosyltransferase